MERRVVVTGLGALTPLGLNVEESWNGVKEGKVGIDKITLIDASEHKAKVAGELKNFNAEEYLGKKEAKRMDRFTQLAVIAAREAIKDSGIDLERVNRERFGVIVSSGIGGLGTIEEQVINKHEKGVGRVSPFFVPMSIINLVAGTIAIEFGAKGICSSVVTACATGTQCIGEAFRNIKHGYSDIIIAGSSEAPITPMGVAGFASMKALSKSEDPLRASIPFDKERNGFVMGEGAGMLILEDMESALKRGAKIYAEVVGYGSTCDAHHITAPDPSAEMSGRALELAMEEGHIKPEEVSYINAHGTSTELNDKTETRAIKRALGDYAYKVAVSSTKSMTGHLLGAAGSVEGIFAVKAIEDSFIPPTVGYKVPDEECDLDYTPNEGRNSDVQVALSSSLGFGGHNAVIAFRKWDGR
ncbi:3-oxoacyl-[acyl-carrier-protein] synthase 2 [Clostridium bornimense]|uniref:3-oxoacyl-[acyl-carrier-protein] synthase 2 n=1 Tax=Clostridium bornimense TaxID=1216932 RepID=W6S5Z5_9CLOT|nr:beta-ketoacyl-ACP synthase II [Clostridium bornimense]CDM69772.1 3-oxoacyl-[acyl-carrier-protein] synthase 2 [Clostridium bornimense]